MGKRRTHDEFVKEIFQKYGDEYSIISQYNKVKEKIKIKHNICGNIFDMTPDNFLRRRKCPICNNKSKLAYTTESFIEKMNQINPSIKINGNYVGSAYSIDVECCICGNSWSTTPNILLRGKTSCNICNSRKISYNEFLNRLNKIENIVHIGSYDNMSTKTEFKCLKHDVKFIATPKNIINGSEKCPKCRKVPIITNEIFKKRVYSINKDVEILGNYQNMKTRVKCKCKKHNIYWDALPLTLYNGCGCPMCKKSRGESIISKYLDEKNIGYELFKKFPQLKGVGGRSLSYDFYLPKYKTLIEFQGKFHDGSVPYQTAKQYQIQLEHDKRKRNYAYKNNYNLIEIWYQDITNVNEILNTELNKISLEVV